jgi:hypothetical protein
MIENTTTSLPIWAPQSVVTVRLCYSPPAPAGGLWHTAKPANCTPVGRSGQLFTGNAQQLEWMGSTNRESQAARHITAWLSSGSRGGPDATFLPVPRKCLFIQTHPSSVTGCDRPQPADQSELTVHSQLPTSSILNSSTTKLPPFIDCP